MNRNLMNCADLARIINSDQVQSKLREVRQSVRAHDKTKKNPLTNKAMMGRLNPFYSEQCAAAKKDDERRQKARKEAIKAKRSKAGKQVKSKRSATYHKLQEDLKSSYKAAEDLIAEEERQGNYVPGDTSEEDE